MVTRISRCSVALIALVLASCTLIDHPIENHDLQKLLDDYQRRSADAQKAALAAVKTLTVTGTSTEALVTVDLERAPLNEVVPRILDAARLPFLVSNVSLHGTVTTRFEKLPVVDALNLLLSTRGLNAELRTGVVVIESGESRSGARTIVPTQPGATSVEVPLQWIDTTTAGSILAGLFPVSPGGGGGPPPPVQYALQPNTNTVFLVGEAGAVERTRSVLLRADRESPHILIEALVVEFDRDALERLETDISNGAFHSFSAIGASFGDLLRNGLTFTRTAGAHNTAAFTLLVNYLTSQDRARLVSRPYIATYSGQQAVINITSNRYVIVQTAQQGATVTSPTAVSSGVTLTITPTATSEGMIRTVLQVTDSQFVPTAENVAVEVDQNQATTTMVVEDGQSIIVGGLVLDRRASANSGVPGLRNIPLLNLLFANQSASRNQEEVFVVLTPHLWQPGMSTPMVDPTAFAIRQ